MWTVGRGRRKKGKVVDGVTVDRERRQYLLPSREKVTMALGLIRLAGGVAGSMEVGESGERGVVVGVCGVVVGVGVVGMRVVGDERLSRFAPRLW